MIFRKRPSLEPVPGPQENARGFCWKNGKTQAFESWDFVGSDRCATCSIVGDGEDLLRLLLCFRIVCFFRT